MGMLLTSSSLSLESLSLSMVALFNTPFDSEDAGLTAAVSAGAFELDVSPIAGGLLLGTSYRPTITIEHHVNNAEQQLQ